MARQLHSKKRSTDHDRTKRNMATLLPDIETASLLRLPVESQIAYIAGLVDGEGYIGIVRREATDANKRLTPKHTGRISVAMCERAPLDFMCLVLRLPVGKMRVKPRRRNAHIHRDCFVVDIENDYAAAVAKLLAPFLLVKRKQAQLVIELRELQRSGSRRDLSQPYRVLQFKGGTSLGRNYIVNKTSDQHVERCEAIYQQCKALNRKGPRSDNFGY